MLPPLLTDYETQMVADLRTYALRTLGLQIRLFGERNFVVIKDAAQVVHEVHAFQDVSVMDADGYIGTKILTWKGDRDGFHWVTTWTAIKGEVLLHWSEGLNPKNGMTYPEELALLSRVAFSQVLYLIDQEYPFLHDAMLKSADPTITFGELVKVAFLQQTYVMEYRLHGRPGEYVRAHLNEGFGLIKLVVNSTAPSGIGFTEELEILGVQVVNRQKTQR